MQKMLVMTVLLIGLCLTPGSRGQDRPEKKAAPSPREQVDRRFASGPAVGDPLPDVSVYDADGKPFETSQLRGHYSVLVFGCLT